MAKETHIYDADGDLVFVLQARSVSTINQSAGTASADSPADRASEAQQDSGNDLPHKTSSQADQDVHFLVSSKHMTLASPIFKAMLGSFREGEELRQNGKVTVPLPDDDPLAFEILMNIVHGKCRKVPRKVTFDLLVTLAILVDKYQLHESVTVYSDRWTEASEFDCAGTIWYFKACWLCFAWVFKLDDRFKNLTEHLIRFGESDICARIDAAGDLPIPQMVIERIAEERVKVIEKLRLVLTSTANTLVQSSHRNCEISGGSAFRCDAMALGTLLMHAEMLNLGPNSTTEDIAGGAQFLSQAMESIKIQSDCDDTPSLSTPCFEKWERLFRADIKKVMSSVHGLSLAEFQ